MCTSSGSDLEDVPLQDDDDSTSLEFRILEFYAKHHVFARGSSALSPRLLRTRSLSQRSVGGRPSDEPGTQGPPPCRNSPSSEKAVNLAKKKSSWRTLFGVVEKQAGPQGAQFQGPRSEKPQRASHSQHWFPTLCSAEQRAEQEAVAPEVVSIANRVAEIVHSWPPPEEFQLEGFSEPKRTSSPGTLPFPAPGSAPTEARARKDGDDQLIAKIVELLKYSGDRLERELRRDPSLRSGFPDGLSYSVFKSIADQFLQGVDTRGESEAKAQSFKAALAIDVMAKLTAVDNHPMNRVLGFGSKYLKENFSPWVQQHGGWGKVLGTPHEDVD